LNSQHSNGASNDSATVQSNDLVSFDDPELSNDGLSNSTSSSSKPASSKELDMLKQKKLMEKYVEDEDLGDLATQAMPLYSNLAFPNLRQEMKDLTERYKYICKMWRKLDSNSKLIYVNKSRQNRYKKKSDEKSTSTVVTVASAFAAIAKQQQPSVVVNPAAASIAVANNIPQDSGKGLNYETIDLDGLFF
jgi:hypothetical protein